MNEKEILDLWDTTRRTPHDPKRVLDLWDTTRTDNYQLQQMRNRQRMRRLAMIPLASGVITVGLAFGSLVPAYAEPILEPQIGHEPNVPHKHLKHLFHRFHSEPLLRSQSEPSESPVLQETPKKDTGFQPKPSTESEEVEPISNQPSPIEEKIEKREEPQKVDQPIEKKEPEHTTAPVKAPTTTVHAEPASIQTFSAKGVHESQPLKRVKEISSPSAKEAEQPVAVNTDSVTPKEIDTTPLRKTENGGDLPKTAGDSVSIAIFGLLLIAGGGQLEAARRMWLKHV
ncbi:hypothetical protein H1164_15760 [Thermoactinomyces daqus]|uniref:Uncharacterized protein n=1 Tax=Thermoactinomyces daqus TaxID=1329516 RepID=A0A7W1XCX0_9BACL|nr:hypothetical protein [Thermoactinomyces daqus]MBA4544308.1 hypothetical protein [Thermoactinomyces daqus]